MYCSQCGTKREENEKTCTACGNAFRDEAVAEGPTEESPAAEAPGGESAVVKGAKSAASGLPKNLIIGVAAVVVVVIAAFAAIKLIAGGSSASPFGKVSDSMLLFKYAEASDETLCIVSGVIIDTIDEELDMSMFSLDESVAVVIDADDTASVVTSKGVKKIASDVYEVIISDDGSGIAYITEYDFFTGMGNLYLYDVKGASSKRITIEAMYPVISPDGKTVAYAGDHSFDEDTFKGYVSMNGKDPEPIRENALPVAVSNGAKYLYYIKAEDAYYGEGALYVKSGNKETKLASSFNYGETVYLNKDYSQAIYTNEGKSYISIKGDEKTKIISSGMSCMITPRYAAISYKNYNVIYDISDFAQKAFIAYDNNVHYIDSKYKATKVVSSNSGYPMISDDGNTLLYIKNNSKLSKIKNLKRNASPEEVIGEKVQMFTMDSAGSKIYFVNKDNELYYVKGAKTEKISDDVYAGDFSLEETGNTLYFISDEYLYLSKNGGAKTKVEGADEAAAIARHATGMMFYKHSEDYRDYDMYYIKSGAQYELLAEGVELY